MSYLHHDIFRWVTPAAMLLALLIFPLQVTAELTTEQGWGKQIYFEGTSPNGGEISAVVGTEAVSLPASAVPCASCHGSDGLGRREGGVIPPDIRWTELTKVYGHVHENGRKHPAFGPSSLARLIRTGLDPDDNQLDRSMPLYSMSVKDMRSLVAYIRLLENDWDPGITKETIQIGTLLPLQGALGQAMAQVMHAHFKEINERGGIFGRKLELLTIPYGSSVETTLDNLRSAIRQEGVFALVGAYTIGMDEQILDLLGQEKMPMVGPFTLNPGDAYTNADIFYIYPGFAEQVQALAGQAAAQMTDVKGQFALVGPQDDNVESMLAAVRDRQPKDENIKNDTLRYERGKLDAPALAASLKQTGREALIFLGVQAELEALLNALAEIKHNPRIYALSAYISRPLRDLPAAFNGKIYLAYPTLSSDVSTAGRAEYLRLADRHALPRSNLQGQVAALAAVKLLEEGLRAAGRTLNRERLVEAIEALYRFDTGLTPPLTYGPNRRIGAMGGHVMLVDRVKKGNSAAGGWREVK